jgi:glutamine synthetase
VTRLEDPMLAAEHSGHPPEAPQVSLIAHGYQYLSEARSDEISFLLDLLQDTLERLGMPLATIEDEWGPGQLELTFAPTLGLRSADNMVLVRSAVKQVCRRHGYHATFMARPAFANANPSGWHLHQSLTETITGRNLFADTETADGLSDLGRWYLGGLLAHAQESSLLTNPTVNSYKRFEPGAFAPDTVSWARDTRGAMLRVLSGGADAATRIENRVGDPTANPYLYLASQLVAGGDGIKRRVEPGPAATHLTTALRPKLPRSLMEAIEAFRRSDLFRAELGETVVNYLLRIKEHEVTRFLSYVTDWEQREYFDVF